MATQFQRENAHQLWGEIDPLLRKHWHEVAHYKDIELNPDVELYGKLEDIDALRCYTARINGQLVGYCIFFVKNMLHYKQVKQAVQDVFFVLPEYRDKRVGYQLLKFCHAQLAAEQVDTVAQHVKFAHDFGPLLEHMGYEPIEKIYMKRLDKE